MVYKNPYMTDYALFSSTTKLGLLLIRYLVKILRGLFFIKKYSKKMKTLLI